MLRGQTGGNTADASPSKESSLGVSALGTHRSYGLTKLCWVACSAALALGISVATGLIPKWGQWYSVNMAYRRQTEAMLQGSLALDNDPRTVGYDMAWASMACSKYGGLACRAGGFRSSWSPSCSGKWGFQIASRLRQRWPF